MSNYTDKPGDEQAAEIKIHGCYCGKPYPDRSNCKRRKCPTHQAIATAISAATTHSQAEFIEHVLAMPCAACTHSRSSHQSFSDHDECSECSGDEPCTEFTVSMVNGRVYQVLTTLTEDIRAAERKRIETAVKAIPVIFERHGVQINRSAEQAIADVLAAISGEK